MFKKFCFFVVFFVAGCTGTYLYIPDDFFYREIKTDSFTLASWQRISDENSLVKIYIEGDGAAFDAYGQPRLNPTPKGTMFREIAFGDNHANVVYLARPCQFVYGDKCVQKYWTMARFAPEVIDAMAQAIYNIAGRREVILIGFSGGAQVAGLVAVTHSEIKVKKLITIAGNLDHQAWTDYHHLPNLSQSMDLSDYKEHYLNISQVHYVGTKDSTIPLSITEKFVSYNNVYEVSGATHNQGWESIYDMVRAED